MVWMDRSAARWLLAATAFAAWCAGSAWALLETTHAYPGIVSMKPGFGAFELSEAALHMPALQALACLFLLAFLLIALVGGLRRLLDPDRLAIDAVLWVLRSKTLWLAAGIATAVALACIAVPAAWWDNASGGIAIAAFATMALVPFAALNAGTLQRAQLSAWWRPCWPGWQALVLELVVLGLGWVADITSFLLGLGAGYVPALVASSVAGEVVSFLAWLFVAIVWIERTTVAAGWRSFFGVLRWRCLRPILWQTLLAAIPMAGIAAPVLVGAILAIYAIPQYEQLAKSGGTHLSWPLRALAQVASRFGTLALLPAAMVMLATVLAKGRLLVSLGIGKPRPPG